MLPHAGSDTQWPGDWWTALKLAIGPIVELGLRIEGISIAGQQHGLVTASDDGEPILPAPLWNNTDAALDAERLNRATNFAAEVGSRLVASIHDREGGPSRMDPTRATVIGGGDLPAA